MDYKEILHKLYTLAVKKKVRLGLEPIRKAHLLFGSPADVYPIIHIAGTNGKGSVAAKLSEILTNSGYRVGLYTSPHLHSYRERIQINNEYITETAVVQLLQEIFCILNEKNISLTFFEYSTLLSWIYFQRNQVDIAIMETGLGGKWDATNLITPILSIITTISLDHTEYLGSSISSIAKEKAGIIKSGVPVIVGPKAQYYPVLREAQLQKSPIMYVSKGKRGFFDEENQEIVRACLPFLARSYCFTKDAIEKGIKKQPPCRFEVLSCQEKMYIFDVAHNKESLQALCTSIANKFPGKPLQFLINFSFHKDILGCLQIIAEIAHHIHIVPSCHMRLAPVQYITECLEQLDYKSYSSYQSVEEMVLNAMGRPEIVVVTGSFYIMSEIQSVLGICKGTMDPVTLSEVF